MKSFLRALPIIALAAGNTAMAGLVQPLQSSPQILIPAAASTPGANGTFFRSDITIINLAGRDQTIELRWLPQAGAGATETRTITLQGTGPGYILRSPDFVRDYLGETGLGAIVITGTDSAGLLDPAARLYVAMRIWTVQPGTGGTTSQSFPTVPVGAVHTQGAVTIPGMGAPNNTGSFRTNLGIVNLDPSNVQTFRISWTLPGVPELMVATVTVPPLSMIQEPAPLDLGAAVENITPSQTRSDVWTAYGSTVDNITGDAWSELAFEDP